MYFAHPQFKKFKPLFKNYSEAELKKKLAKFFPDCEIIFTDMGRSAFQLAIKSLNLKNSEMLVPGYICDIFSSIFDHYDIKPIYLDIDLDTFHIKESGIESKITPKTKSILVCHTYGLLVKNKIFELAEKHNLKIIEDCAHVPLGLPRMELKGDCAFFSFSKIFPTINGGMLVCKPSYQKLFSVEGKKSFKFSDLIKLTRLFPVLANLSEKIRPKVKTLASSQFSAPKKPSKNSLQTLGWYLDNFEKQISKRNELAKYFQEKLRKIGFETSPGTTYISALVPKNVNRDYLFKKLRKKKVFCSRIWYKPIYNPPTNELPNTQEAARRIINFPFQSWLTKKDIDKIISYI